MSNFETKSYMSSASLTQIEIVRDETHLRMGDRFIFPIITQAEFEKRYTFQDPNPIGSGMSSKVYAVVKNGKLYAYKEKLIDLDEKNGHHPEGSLHRRLALSYGEQRHLQLLEDVSHIPKLHDFFVIMDDASKSIKVGIVQELVEFGACGLYSKLGKKSRTRMANRLAIWIFRLIAQLHQRDIVHGDIQNLENILIDSNKQFWLVDFGQSYLDIPDPYKKDIRSHLYLDYLPEHKLMCYDPYTREVEIYLIGVALYLAVHCKYPRCRDYLAQEKETPLGLAIFECLQPDPKARPEPTRLLELADLIADASSIS